MTRFFLSLFVTVVVALICLHSFGSQYHQLKGNHYNGVGGMRKLENVQSNDGLDFIIAAFPKCATSSLQDKILGTQDEVHMIKKVNKKTNSIMEYILKKEEDVEDLSRQIEEFRDTQGHDSNVKVGIKWPLAIVGKNIEFLTYLKKQNPTGVDPKIIIGMRHPVRWFESFYNFRIRDGQRVPPLTSLSDPTRFDDLRFFTNVVQFEKSIMQLGKVPLNVEELKLMSEDERPVVPTTNKVLLYVEEQLMDHETAANLFQDMKEFLGLEKPISVATADKRDHHSANQMDICEPEFTSLRKVLTDSGKKSYTWIRDNFAFSSDVVIAGKEDFLNLIKHWATDPCELATVG